MLTLSRRMQRFHGFTFVVAADWRAPLGAIPLAEVAEWTVFRGGEQVGWAGKTNCFQVTLEDGQRVFFKRYVYQTRLWTSWCRPAKPVIETWGYGVLRGLGVTVPEVLAWGEYRRCGFLKAAFIVTREVPGAMDLRRFAEQHWSAMPEREKQRVFRELSGALLEQLHLAHGNGFFHHDLKWRNVLVRREDGRYATVWIDCPRAYLNKHNAFRPQVAEISALARVALTVLPQTSRLRFLHAYLSRSHDQDHRQGSFRQRWTRLVRAVDAHLSRRPPRGYMGLPGKGKIVAQPDRGTD